MSFFAEICPELSRLPTEKLKTWFKDARVGDDCLDGPDAAALQEAAARIAESDPDAVDFLRSCIPEAGEEKLVAILLGLSIAANPTTREEVVALVRPFLADARPRVVAEAVDALKHLGCTEARADVLSLKDHSSPLVVGSVLRFLARHFPDEAIPLLEQALASPEPTVRENAVDELDELEYLPALPRIKELTADANEDVRQAAEWAVEHLEAAGRS